MPSKKRTGRVQLRVARALRMAGKPLTSREILSVAYPRGHREKFQYWHYDSMRRAALRFARLVGRKGRQPLWGLKEWESDCS
jgi:hypothetical protein